MNCKECPIGSYIQSEFYNAEGDDATCNFCESILNDFCDPLSNKHMLEKLHELLEKLKERLE